MSKLKPERRFPFGGVEVYYEDGEGNPTLKVLAPPEQCLELSFPTAEEIDPLREQFGNFVRDLMKKESDPEYLDAFKNYAEVKTFYFDEIVPKVRDMLLGNYPDADDRQIIDKDMTYTQVARMNDIIARVFNYHSVLVVLAESEGTLSGN